MLGLSHVSMCKCLSQSTLGATHPLISSGAGDGGACSAKAKATGKQKVKVTVASRPGSLFFTSRRKQFQWCHCHRHGKIQCQQCQRHRQWRQRPNEREGVTLTAKYKSVRTWPWCPTLSRRGEAARDVNLRRAELVQSVFHVVIS